MYPEQENGDMKDYKKVFLASCFGLVLALFGRAPRAEACYMSPASFENSFSAFVADFNRWDASLDYQPLLALASTPDQDRFDMGLVLWWFWANGYGRSSDAVNTGVLSLGPSSHTLSLDGQPSTDTGSEGLSLLLPPLGNNSPTPPIGIIADGPLNAPPSGGNGPQGENPRPNVAGVPEPSTLTLLGLGVAGLAGYGRRWRNARA
jgi:hypothetical protein